MKHLCILFFLILTGFSCLSQELPTKLFYKHFHGNINKTVNISANIIKVNDTVYGNYYTWFFDHETQDFSTITSETMPLNGNMVTPTEFFL